RDHETRLRRAQALAQGSGVGRRLACVLVRQKLERQAEIAERLAYLRPTLVPNRARAPITVGAAIRAERDKLKPTLDYAAIRLIEAHAGRHYWETWALVSPCFSKALGARMPSHWRTAGPRTSQLDSKRAHNATTPVQAILNYTYAMLQVEAIIA